MGLKAAVASAATPEELAEVMREIGRRYLAARDRETAFAAAKREIRDACVAALRRLETESYEWSVDGKRFRATRYDVVTVTPGEQLASLLSAAGLNGVCTSRVVWELDEESLWKAVRRGQVSIDDIRLHSVVKTTEGFRITELKGGDESASSNT